MLQDGAWAMEEAFRCHAIAAIVGEFGRAKNSLDLTVPRRLALVAAREGRELGLLRIGAASPSVTIIRCVPG